MAGSDHLLRVVNRIDHQPRPLMVLAAVHFLLMGGASPELAGYYPSLADDPLPADDIGAPFSRFVRDNEETIVEIGHTRHIQTNECRRCVALLPAIWELGVERFHLVDLGTSAGLNLAMDRYRYRWDDITWGPDSQVALVTESRGDEPKPHAIEVISRTGLDLNPLDITDESERRWLRALIWPESEDRRERLDAAIGVVRSIDTRLVAGSAIETLGPVLDDLGGDTPAVVVNSFVLNQLTDEQRGQLDRVIEGARTRRQVYRVSMEIMEAEEEAARLRIDTGTGWSQVGWAHPHGEWLRLG